MKILKVIFFIYISITYAFASTLTTFPVSSSILQETQGFLRLKNWSKYSSFIQNVLIPTLGQRSIWTHSPQISDNIWTWDLNDIKLEIHFDANQNMPTLIKNDGVHSLYWPRRFDFGQMPDFLRQLFISTELYPFFVDEKILQERKQLGESFILKEEQLAAINFFNDFIKSGEKSAIVVAPTGVGKSRIIQDTILNIKKYDPNALIVVVSDLQDIVESLYKPFKENADSYLKTAKLGRWKELSKKNHSVVFMPRASLTTSNGLSFVDKNKHRKIIVIYDEAHHVGAEKFFKWINQEEEIVILGLTATPLSENKEYNNFWTRKFSTHQDLSEESSEIDLMAQTVAAIKRGHILYPESLHYFDVNKIEGEENAIRIRDPEVENLYMINPIYYDQIAKHLEKIFLKNTHGFIKVSTQNEARKIRDYLNILFPEIGFGVYTSNEEDSKNTLDDFHKGRIHYLISIQKLKEGIDFPILSAFIDLSFTESIISTLQNLGRILRPYPGKLNVFWIKFMETSVEEMYLATQKYLQNHLEDIDSSNIISSNAPNELKISLNHDNIPLLVNLSLIEKSLNLQRTPSPAQRLFKFFNDNESTLPTGNTEHNLYRLIIYELDNNAELFLKEVQSISSECFKATEMFQKNLIQKRAKRAKRSERPQGTVAERVVKFFSDNESNLPTGKTDLNLYQAIINELDKSADPFLEEVQLLSPKCCKKIQKFQQELIQKRIERIERTQGTVAERVVKFFNDNESTLPTSSTDENLTRSIIRALDKNAGEFFQEVQLMSNECLTAIQKFQQKLILIREKGTVAERVVKFFNDNESTLPTTTTDENLIRSLIGTLDKNEGEFLEEVQLLSNECLKAIQKFQQKLIEKRRETSKERPAERVVKFFNDNESTLPTSTTDSKVYGAVKRALDKNAEAFLKEVETLSQECFKEIEKLQQQLIQKQAEKSK